MRVFSAAAVAIVLCSAAPAFADAQSHVQAAKKAEKRGEWKKALQEWKAAYNTDMNAEYLIGIGDAYAKLGNAGEAKKSYEAYLADPLALPGNVEKVKTKLAGLDNTGGGLALPGAAPAAATALALPGSEPSAPPSLDLAAAAPAADKGKKGGKKGNAAPPPSALDLPGAAPTAVASNDKKPADPMLALPGLDLPAATPEKKYDKKGATAAAAGAGAAALDLPPLPGATTTTPPKSDTKKDQTAVASNQAKKTSTTSGQQVAMTTTQPKPPATTKVPEAATTATPSRTSQSEASGNKTFAYVAAGVAVVGLGSGALFYSKASSAQSDVTGSKHDQATTESLLSSEKSNKTLSAISLGVGLLATGFAVAMFAF